MNHFYAAEENIHMPLNGSMSFLRQIKVMRIQSGFDQNAYHLQTRFNGGNRKHPELSGADVHKSFSQRPVPSRPNGKTNFATYLRPLQNLFSGAHGELYEKVNGEMHPLGEVATDQTGKAYELVRGFPVSNDIHKKRDNGRTQRPPIPANDMSDDPELKKDNLRADHSFREAKGIRSKPYGLVYEKLFPDPGYYLRLPFMPFERELRNQIKYPERLTLKSLIDCMVQVYRIRRPITFEHLALVEIGDAKQGMRLNLLSRSQARILGLNPEEPKNFRDKWPPHVIRPGQHVFHISLLYDPAEKMEHFQNPTTAPTDYSDPADDAQPTENPE